MRSWKKKKRKGNYASPEGDWLFLSISSLISRVGGGENDQALTSKGGKEKYLFGGRAEDCLAEGSCKSGGNSESASKPAQPKERESKCLCSKKGHGAQVQPGRGKKGKRKNKGVNYCRREKGRNHSIVQRSTYFAAPQNKNKKPQPQKKKDQQNKTSLVVFGMAVIA